MSGRKVTFVSRLTRWYRGNRRELPWRVGRGRPDPYFVLVSELMLQQTQVGTVVPYFVRFMERFPTVESLSGAEVEEVLLVWQGLGYYARARNLHAAARIVVRDHGGRIPSGVEELRKLPGIGRYTAGAIASLAYGRRAAIVDGNVARVLCRVDGIEEDPKQSGVRERLWRRAEELLPGKGVSDFNSGLMELGATVCTFRRPACGVCPVRVHCEAVRLGLQDRIPAVGGSRERPLEERWTFCIREGDKWLIERRPGVGRWAGMWQFVTISANGGKASVRLIGERLGLRVTEPRFLARIGHDLTHRRYRFEVYVCEGKGRRRGEADGGRVWVSLGELSGYAMSRAQQRIARLLGVGGWEV